MESASKTWTRLPRLALSLVWRLWVQIDSLNYMPWTRFVYLLLSEGFRDDVNDFDVVASLLLVFLLPESSKVVGRVRSCISYPDGGLEQTKSMKEAYTPAFAMTGVAGAIIAQIALTALALPQLNAMHWSAQACFVVGLVAGALSVFDSCVLQGVMSSLQTAREIRDWFTSVNHAHGMTLSTIDQQIDDNNAKKLGRIRAAIIRPSLTAAILVSTPSRLLYIALLALLIGFGLYFGHVYTLELPAPLGDNGALKVFIAYLICIGIGQIMFNYPMNYKDAKRDRSASLMHRSDDVDELLQRINAAHEPSFRERCLDTTTKATTIIGPEESLRRLVEAQSQQLMVTRQILDALLATK